jgi:hypothetical protein
VVIVSKVQALGATRVEVDHGGVVARRAAYHRLFRPLLRIRDHNQKRCRTIPMPLLLYTPHHRGVRPYSCRAVDDLEPIPAEACPAIGGMDALLLCLRIAPLRLRRVDLVKNALFNAYPPQVDA